MTGFIFVWFSFLIRPEVYSAILILLTFVVCFGIIETSKREVIMKATDNGNGVDVVDAAVEAIIASLACYLTGQEIRENA